MDDSILTQLAVAEIVRETQEFQLREDQQYGVAERKVNPLGKPNKRFLGSTLNSILSHNQRKDCSTQKKCRQKLEELDDRRKRQRRHKRKHSRSKESSHICEVSSDHSSSSSTSSSNSKESDVERKVKKNRRMKRPKSPKSRMKKENTDEHFTDDDDYYGNDDDYKYANYWQEPISDSAYCYEIPPPLPYDYFVQNHNVLSYLNNAVNGQSAIETQTRSECIVEAQQIKSDTEKVPHIIDLESDGESNELKFHLKSDSISSLSSAISLEENCGTISLDSDAPISIAADECVSNSSSDIIFEECDNNANDTHTIAEVKVAEISIDLTDD